MTWQTILAFVISLLLFEQLPVDGTPVATALSKPDDSLGTPNESTDIPLAETEDTARLTVQVHLSQSSKRTSNEFTVYPYPVEPPVDSSKTAITYLATDRKTVRENIKTLGYILRTGKAIPYPTCGYRVNYAFKAALKRYGGGQPHTLAEVYRFMDELQPYMEVEVLKSNEETRTRFERMKAAQENYANNRTDIETEAVKDGLTPQEIRVGQWQGPGQLGTVMLPKAKWWVAGTHKSLGLTFYWQEPVDLSKGDQVVQLTEKNALLVKGAW